MKFLGGKKIVKPPIQKTNLRMKNVDYNSCYKLWLFISAYTNVGYAIDVKDKSLPVDANDFKQDVDFETGKILLGDIVICFDKVRSQAEEYGHGEERECAYLALHGLLHLLGFDHTEDGDRAVMRGHEEAILGSLNILR